MPWCPRCDEVFPDGTACPRCRARLVPSDGGRSSQALQPVEELPQLKVPRRYRRAFDRLSEPRAPSPRLLAVAGASLLFAVGFLLGRLGSPGTSQPTVHALPPAEGLAALDADGSASYLLWSSRGDRLATIASHDLYSGEVTPRARFSAPSADFGERTQVAALDGSVALVLGGDDGSFVAVAPRDGAPFGWISGVEAAWEASDALLVREEDGTVVRWSTERRAVVSALEGRWERLLQTTSGAALVGSGHLVVRSPNDTHATIDLPPGAEVLSVSPDGMRALIDREGPALWDGRNAVAVRVDGYVSLGAAFAASGDQVAVTMRGADGDLVVGIVDSDGHVSLKPLGTRSAGSACTVTPAWDARGRWVYVAFGDGSIHVAEAAGGRVEAVPARLVGCGLGWSR